VNATPDDSAEVDSEDIVPEPAAIRGPEGLFHRYWRKIGAGSLMVAILLHVGLLVLGAMIVYKTIQEPEKTVDFIPGKGGGGGGGGEMQKRAERMAKSTPVQSLRRVSAEGATTSVVMPDPGDSFGQMASLGSLSGGGGMGGGSGLGSGGGHGNGVGTGTGNGVGAGGFGTGTIFFNQEIKASRVAYVIDFSLSMSGKREKLMRQELERSVRQLSPLMHFQLIFFSGPVWIAGDTVDMNLGNKDAVVRHGDTEYKWEAGKTPGSWENKGKKPEAEWMTASPEAIDLAATRIQKTPLQYGTHWVSPLEMALAMTPPPDVIFFMTDGASAATTERDIDRIGSRARSRKTVINTMALMEPDAEAGMKELARRSKGRFTIIDSTGTAREVPLDK
jgi:hypothetical protein